jgi:hypothetical protein
LARTSLCVVCAMVALVAAASCLVSSTPTDLQPAKMTAPYLSALRPDPLKILIIPRASAATGLPPTYRQTRIAFDVVSEDLGNDLQALVVLDYQPGSSSQQFLTNGVVVIPAGHLDDPKPRHVDIDFTLQPATEAGCHSFTLIVTHLFQPYPLAPARQGDAAFAVWWVDADDDITSPKATLARCSAEFPRPDGGVGGAAGGP